MRTTDPADPKRRLLLKRLGLAVGIAYVAPALTGVGRARASVPGRGSRPSRPSLPSRPSRPNRQTRQAPPPEIVALLPEGQSAAPIEAAGYAILARSEVPSLAATLLRLALPAGRTGDAARDEIATLVPGAGADLNHLYLPDDFLCDVDACAAHDIVGWSHVSTSGAPRIGMIDTGINTAHHAFEGQNLMAQQIDLAKREASGRQHGTAIAALLVGRSDDRVPGLLPEAELVAVEAFHRGGAGDQADAFSVVAALDLLLRDGMETINLSFSGPENEVLARIVRAAAAQGVALVAAAGNGGPGAPPAFPAAWPEVIAVTAVDSALNVYRQANQGHYIALAAPGVNLWTAASISGGRLRSGTSYAAPFVTAALAVERLHDPGAELSDLVARVTSCARDLGAAGFDPVFGHGLVTAPDACDATAGQVFSIRGE